jgi:integrase
MKKAIGSLKNSWSIHAVSKAVAGHINRGFATSEKVETVLREMKEFGIRNINKLDEDKVQEIAEHVAKKVHEGEISGKTGATYFSALNAVIDYVNHNFDKEINELRYSEFDIHKDTDYQNRSISEETLQNFQSFLQEKYEQTGDNKFQALEYATELQREFGLRFRESAGLNVNTIEKGLETGKLELDRQDWTKNAREREIQIRTEEQKELLNEVKNFLEQQEKINLAGAENAKEYQPIANFRSFADNIRAAFSKETNQNFSFHGERHAWAQERYSQGFQEKTGVSIQAPIKYYSEELSKSGWTGEGEGKFYDAVEKAGIKNFWEYASEKTGLEISELKSIDKEIRQEISEELGHNRLDITNAYLGHS